MCEKNGSELIYPGCQQRGSTDPLLFGAWIVARRCWQLHGGPRRNPASNDRAQSLNLGLRTGHFSPLWIRYQISFTFSHISSICLHISAQLSQALPSPLHFPCYGKLYLSAHLPCPFLRSVFQDVDTRYQDIDHFDTSQFSSKQVKCKICPECLFFKSTHSHSQQHGHAVTLRIRPHATVSYALLVYSLSLFFVFLMHMSHTASVIFILLFFLSMVFIIFSRKESSTHVSMFLSFSFDNYQPSTL